MSMTPGADAQRDLVEGIIRGRRMADAEAKLATAATVVLVRDGARGPEILLLLRPEGMSFAGAWVFPGGKVDDADRVADEDDTARNAAVRETMEETGLTVDPGDLVPIATFVPPPTLPLRIRTWFFAALAPSGELALQASEVVTARWMRPEDMLALHTAGDATLYPPTYVTLVAMSGAESAAALLAGLGSATPAHFETRLTKRDGGLLFHWGLDDGTGSVPPARRHRLDTRSLPWIYTTPTP